MDCGRVSKGPGQERARASLGQRGGTSGLPREHACRKCRTLTSGKICPNCKSTELSGEWTGLVIILESANSQVAKTLQISKPGRYALKVT